ncbi:hypothetical protein DEU56DRAFT_818020 [Suillus clintonianus]|uniref:uncharacterized protein n=1 Tax=Suillus clintonianus TaxID=1904413 RepID=UPI001B883445|nr:uncharacterized protein DEU56DRAFT_818020 [Suillus clintonianus]KAG2129145.1 hypothetical protein DEU56DRAFT_818020 [Suillus clintonianus]
MLEDESENGSGSGSGVLHVDRSVGTNNLELKLPLVIPPDPRDHTVLEAIYNEMHAQRFINLSPLSLLANQVGLWFKGESFILSFCCFSFWVEGVPRLVGG